MKITGTVVRLGIFSLVLLLFTVMIIVVFGQMRFDRTNGVLGGVQQRQRAAAGPIRPRLRGGDRQGRHR